MGDREDREKMASDIGEIRATVATELGRLKSDFTVLNEKLDRVREYLMLAQQTSQTMAAVESRLQKVSEEIRSVINRLEAVERSDSSTEKFIDRELGHLRTEVHQEIVKALLELDNSIKERLPASTITDSIEELFALTRKAGEDIRQLFGIREANPPTRKEFDELGKLVTDMRIDNGKQSVRISLVIAGITLVVNLVIGVVVKNWLDRTGSPPSPQVQTQYRYHDTASVR